MLYLLVVGPRPSLLRASVMAGLGVAALLAERPPQTANALAVAAAGLCLADPSVLLSAGFRLTVAATAGIVLLGPRLDACWQAGWRGRGGSGDRGRGFARWIGRLGTGLRRAVAASVGAQLGVLPWALPLFCLVTPWAPLANLVAVPWTGIALAVSLAWTAVACAAPALAHGLAGAVSAVAAPFAWPAAVPPRPWIALPVSVGPVRTALATVGLAILLGAVGGLRSPRRVRPPALVPDLGLALVPILVVVSALVLVLALVVLSPGPVAPDGGGGVSAVMIDVGQGDAILLRDGSHAALVDGGGWRYGDLGGRVLLPVLARLGVRRLDAVIVSHPDRDHCGGLVDIAGYLAVDRAISGPGLEGSRCGRELDALPAVARLVVGRGAELRLGRWRLRVLSPDGPGQSDRPPDRAVGRPGRRPRGSDNDDSLVLQAEVFGRRLLLTGDIEARTERSLVRLARPVRAGRSGSSGPGALRCDVLKVAHHGSRTSSGASFLDAAAPRIALVSAGAHNPYGHPAEEVLARLAARRTAVLRTDRDGMILVSIRPDGRILLRRPGAPKARSLESNAG